jgi:3'-phosphoadenosine 5'-phosphosulfate (PAPS) 3'-phosphatase
MSVSPNGDAELPGEEALSATDHPFTLSQELDLALELADLADQIVVRHVRPEGFAFENKYDGSPVTAIDRQVEQAIRERVATRRPGYAVPGEEEGTGAGEPSHPGAGPHPNPHHASLGVHWTPALRAHGAPSAAQSAHRLRRRPQDDSRGAAPRRPHGPEGEGAFRARWIVDPIDGTRRFVRGIPIFATLLALERDGEIVVGLASAPLMADRGRRWWAAKDPGAFADQTSSELGYTCVLLRWQNDVAGGP